MVMEQIALALSRIGLSSQRKQGDIGREEIMRGCEPQQISELRFLQKQGEWLKGLFLCIKLSWIDCSCGDFTEEDHEQKLS